MAFILREARHEDAPSIAAIQYAAYFTQPGHAQAYGRVPLADHMAIYGYNTERFIAASSSFHAKILVVEDSSTGQVISCAKWFLPVPEGETAANPNRSTRSPDAVYLNFKLLRTYTWLVARAEEDTSENKRCYRLDTVTTFPHAERRGAASMLLQWGIERANRDGLSVYLHAEPLGYPLYKRLGFVDIEGHTIQIPLEEYGGKGDWTIKTMIREPDVLRNKAVKRGGGE